MENDGITYVHCLAGTLCSLCKFRTNGIEKSYEQEVFCEQINGKCIGLRKVVRTISAGEKIV